MRIWSIQTLDAWLGLEAAGILRATFHSVEPDFPHAYHWMIAEMTRRIGPAPHLDAAPIWEWYQYESATKPKPDLRHSAHLPTGTQGVRLWLELDEDAVLLSDFELWHYALNSAYLPLGTHELDRYEQFSNPEAMEASWQRMFDLDFAPEEIAVPRAEKSIQACLWELRLDDVTRVDRFTAR